MRARLRARRVRILRRRRLDRFRRALRDHVAQLHGRRRCRQLAGHDRIDQSVLKRFLGIQVEVVPLGVLDDLAQRLARAGRQNPVDSVIGLSPSCARSRSRSMHARAVSFSMSPIR